LRVAHWLLNEGVDVVITGDDLRQKAPGYVLRDAGVTAMVSNNDDVEAALEEWRTKVTSSKA
jgi:predicted Fe-Mo cluster-binding NifX family protein